uniref:DDB1- and CUL4-associated factor 12 beta-propeller domain-containing protein n=1 Tax=Tetradesmus obliquus TaxID=3088 RepID=A0A383W3K0_TETOB|eukprot:jgi/Sobl393_1/14981/SZX71236.1
MPAAAGSQLSSMLNTLQSREIGQYRSRENTTAHMQQAYINQQLQNLTLTTLTTTQQAVDKAFCAVWLDDETVLVGTKCNSLMMLQPHTGSPRLLQYPQQQQQQRAGVRPGSPLRAVPAAISCGQHGLALSPDGTWLATGGQAPNDILLWRVSRPEQQLPGMQPQAAAAGRSKTVVQPVQALTGHADWVFDLAWLDATHFVSAGRDRLLKLWQLPQTATAAAAAAVGSSPLQFAAEPGAALSTVRYHSDKVRCVKFDQQQQAAVTACCDGVLAWWTPELQLAGACMLPSKFAGPQSLLLQGNLAVVGTQRAAVLIDTRVAHKAVASVDVADAPQRKRRRVGAPAADSVGGGLTADAACQRAQQWNQQQQQQQQQQQWQRQEGGTDDEEPTSSDDESDTLSSADADEEAASYAEQVAGSEQQQQQQQGIDPGSRQRQLAAQFLASLRSNNIAEQQQLQHQLPRRVVYAIQRFVEQEVCSQQARTGSPAMGAADLQCDGQRGSSRLRHIAGPLSRLAAHVSGSICVEGHNGSVGNGVRSLSLHHHLLGLGCCGGQLLMHDMRKLSSTAAAAACNSSSSSTAEQPQQVPFASGNVSSSIPPYSSSWVDGSTGDVPARVGCLGLPDLAWRQPPPAAAAAAGSGAASADADVLWAPALSGSGSVVYDASELAVFTHAWDPSGTQLFMGGGPVVLAGKGCSLALCC